MRAPKAAGAQSGLNKGTWTAEEDEKLITYINNYGIWNWCKMPPYAGLSRTGKSCRLRWMNYLKPNIKRGNFTNKEEETILHYHSLLGNKWSAIARKLPGRTDNEVKNYWHTNLKKQMTQDPIQESEPSKMKTPTHDVEDRVLESNNTDHLFSNIIGHEHSISACMFDTCSRCDPKIKFETSYDISSPGTVEDVKSLWQQLYINSDDVELQNLLEDTFSNESIGSSSLHDI